MQKLRRLVVIGALAAVPVVVPRPSLAQKRAITFADYLALPNVAGPQLAPDGKSIAYTVTTYSLPDNRGTSRIWLADVATGQTRQSRGAGSDRQPRWYSTGGLWHSSHFDRAAPSCALAPGRREVSDEPGDGVFDPVAPRRKAPLAFSDDRAAGEQESTAGTASTYEARL
jgi:dipeptidyl aminopeptidase/acylaminoacyl peptidase